MKVILKDGRRYTLRFMQGEEVLQALREFCIKEGIGAAYFSGIGGCNYLKLSYYNLQTKKYEDKEFKEGLEIANLTGNVSTADGETIIHMHGTFSDRELKAIAGHVMAVKISITCEIFLIALDGKMERKLDENIGLKLLE